LGTGRVYLPAEDLAAFGCALDPASPPVWAQGPAAEQPADGRPPGDTAGMERLIRFEADRARGWYATGLRLMPMLDWRSAASAGAMAGICLRLLGHISRTPAAVLRGRMSLPGKEKLMVAAQSLAGRTPRPPAGVTPARPGTAPWAGETGAAPPGLRS